MNWEQFQKEGERVVRGIRVAKEPNLYTVDDGKPITIQEGIGKTNNK